MGKYDQQIQQTTAHAHDTLGRSQRLVSEQIHRVQQIMELAARQQEALHASLPTLQQRATDAMQNPQLSDDERAESQRAYLECRQKLRGLDQLWQQARRQLVILGADTGTQANMHVGLHAER